MSYETNKEAILALYKNVENIDQVERVLEQTDKVANKHQGDADVDKCLSNLLGVFLDNPNAGSVSMGNVLFDTVHMEIAGNLAHKNKTNTINGLKKLCSVLSEEIAIENVVTALKESGEKQPEIINAACKTIINIIRGKALDVQSFRALIMNMSSDLKRYPETQGVREAAKNSIVSLLKTLQSEESGIDNQEGLDHVVTNKLAEYNMKMLEARVKEKIKGNEEWAGVRGELEDLKDTFRLQLKVVLPRFFEKVLEMRSYEEGMAYDYASKVLREDVITKSDSQDEVRERETVESVASKSSEPAKPSSSSSAASQSEEKHEETPDEFNKSIEEIFGKSKPKPVLSSTASKSASSSSSGDTVQAKSNDNDTGKQSKWKRLKEATKKACRVGKKGKNKM